MAQLIVRNLEDAVKRKLLRRAARHGRSMEDEVGDILRKAVRDEGDRREEIVAVVLARHRRSCSVVSD